MSLLAGLLLAFILSLGTLPAAAGGEVSGADRDAIKPLIVSCATLVPSSGTTGRPPIWPRVAGHPGPVPDVGHLHEHGAGGIPAGLPAAIGDLRRDQRRAERAATEGL